MEVMQIGDRVKCNRDLSKRGVVEGQEGVLEFVMILQSENYLDIRLDDGRMIETSSQNCWDKVEKSR